MFSSQKLSIFIDIYGLGFPWNFLLTKYPHALFLLKVSYIVMDPVAGGLGAVLVNGIFLASGKLVAQGASIGGYPIWQVAMAVHFAAWIIQFIGHGIFEG